MVALPADQVLSRDDSTGAQGYKRVVRLFRGETNRVVHLRIAKAASVQRGRSQRHRVGQGKGGSSSDGEEGSEPARSEADGEQTIRSTVGHPYFVVGRGWVHAKDLKVGDRLSGSLGEPLVVTGLEIREEQAKHYNFEVEGFHTYFVSETKSDPAVWVHNRRCGGRRSRRAKLRRKRARRQRHKEEARQFQSDYYRREFANQAEFRPRHGGYGDELRRHATQIHPELGLNPAQYRLAARANIGNPDSAVHALTGNRFAAYNPTTHQTTIFSFQGRHGLPDGAPTIHSHYVADNLAPPGNSLGQIPYFPQ